MTLPLRTIRAPNPSALTGTGTNTYLLGRGAVAVIDPGPDLDAHFHAILAALDKGETVSHILVTHPHLDHSALAPRLAAATGAVTAAFGSATDGRSRVMAKLAAGGLSDGGEGLDRRFRPDMTLADGDTLTAATWSVEALHTPGHLGAHLCFATRDVLFSGDHVMGWSTSVVAPPDGDMSDYMASLDRLAARRWSRMLPGHGDPIENPAERLTGLIRHRKDREAQILHALASGPATARTLAARLYTDLPQKLLAAASANVLAHLIDLANKDRIKTPPDLGADTIFHAS